MPEGDTIRRLADRVSARFVGETCRRSTMRDPRMVGADFEGARLLEADAIGKNLLLRFSNEVTLHSHLRMHGTWQLGRRAQVPEWKRRVELRMESGWMTAIDVPILGTVATRDEGDVVGHLGPDLCGPVPPDVSVLTESLRHDPSAPLGTAILDQRRIAGFGNLYAVEVAFIAGVSPFRRIDEIERLDQLVAAGTALIRTNARRGPQNTTGRQLTTSHHWIYGRARRPCPWCSTTLSGAGEDETPWGRVTTWCPSCQPAEGPTGADPARIRRALALHPARRDPAMDHVATPDPG
ncbi:DNA-formamidopyrimidine glycosylase family protein [Ilumatobacter sp.]|uniref:DNA-formamidopyrimidine glycosylase family protein n=1 Tax=Ilumatobacter sp. TaxID=1967498 RepID=UPI003B51DE79